MLVRRARVKGDDGGRYSCYGLPFLGLLGRSGSELTVHADRYRTLGLTVVEHRAPVKGRLNGLYGFLGFGLDFYIHPVGEATPGVGNGVPDANVGQNGPGSDK